MIADAVYAEAVSETSRIIQGISPKIDRWTFATLKALNSLMSGSRIAWPYLTKNQPKEEVFGTDIPRTSRGHSRGYPGPKLRSGPSKSWKNKDLGADIHDPKGWTSTTLRDFQKLRSEKLWAEFSFPTRERFAPERCAFSLSSLGKFKHRQVTDLDVTDLGFSGPRIPFCATRALWGRVTPFSWSLF